MLQTGIEGTLRFQISMYEKYGKNNEVHIRNTVPGGQTQFQELEKRGNLMGFRLGLRKLGGFSLRQSEQGVSRPGPKKLGYSRL